MNINHLLLVGLLSITLFTTTQFSYAELEERNWQEMAENANLNYIEKELFPNKDVLKDTIKTRIAQGWTQPYPPPFHSRIIYDIISDDKTETKDLVFRVRFPPPTFSHAELELKYTIDYMAPHRVLKYFNEEIPFIPNTTTYYTNIMCKMGFEKVKKQSNDEFKCVKLESVKKLFERDFIANYIDPKELTKWDLETSHIRYRIDGATIQNMTSHSITELVIDIDSKEKGELLVILPRQLIDSRVGYCNHIENETPDDFFFVIVDDEATDYFERSTNTHFRSLVIEFDNNSTEIKILGSCIP